jgi:hypothetical protein
MQSRSVSHPSARGFALALRLTIVTLLAALSITAMAQTNTTLVPSSCVSTQSSYTGSCSSIGNTPLQTGTGNTPSNEIVLHGQYTGYQVFTLPTSIAPSSITGIQVKVNYQGPSYNRQVWTWQLFNWATNAYVTVGNNSAITPPLDWLQWTVFNFTVLGTLANYVRASDGQMRVQIFSNNSVDDTYIDYEAVIVTSSSSTVSVSVSPTSATLNGGGTQQFAATVTGNSNTSVTWSLTGTGTLTTSGLYTAPATVANSTTATVKATSVADTTKSASATVTLNPVSVSASPATASVQTGATQQFTATVSNTSNTAVTWQVNNVTGGNSTVGTISTGGLYTAPSTVPNPANVTVSAVSQADTTKSGSATVTVTTQSGGIPTPIHGVTVADDYDIRTTSYLNQVIPALTNLSVTPMVRTVFTLEVDSSSQGATASTYQSAIQQIKASTNVSTGQHPLILGQPVDSSYMFCFTQADHAARWHDYVNNLGQYVDVWEIANEINGNWLYNTGPNADTSGESCPSGWPGGVPSTSIQDVANKMVDAFNITKAAGKLAALTLTFCPTDLPAPNQPFTWIGNYVPAALQSGMDYVLISYYPDSTGCAYGLPSASDWVNWFQQLHTLFPNAKLGMGEWGYTSNNPPANLTTVLQEGYQINPSASLPASVWAGGVFYWSFGSTAVPRTGNNKLGSPSDWSDVNTDLQSQH